MPEAARDPCSSNIPLLFCAKSRPACCVLPEGRSMHWRGNRQVGERKHGISGYAELACSSAPDRWVIGHAALTCHGLVRHFMGLRCQGFASKRCNTQGRICTSFWCVSIMANWDCSKSVIHAVEHEVPISARSGNRLLLVGAQGPRQPTSKSARDLPVWVTVPFRSKPARLC